MRTLGQETAIADVVREAHAAGRAIAIVPAGDDKADSIARFGEVLGFPDWFGHNLDALFDCLLQRYRRAPESELVWDGTAGLRERDAPAFDRIRQVLSDAEAECPALSVTILDRM
ncbi:MAG TPA: barstar family protein [Phycicoccus sp.]|nr:barstar family protein [Phycicoccus sp.]